MDRWMDGWTDRWVGGWTDGWTDGWIAHGWVSCQWADGCVDGWNPQFEEERIGGHGWNQNGKTDSQFLDKWLHCS